MQNQHEILGEIIKNARAKADMTVETLANKVGVTERFIYRIENEGKKPSYEILLASGDNRHSGSGEKGQFWSNEKRHLQIE